MTSSARSAIGIGLLLATSLSAQAPTRNPFEKPINATDDVILLRAVEFASIPDLPGQPEPARPMLLLTEPGTRRMFVNDMHGPLYLVSDDGKAVTMYLDVNAPQWKVPVESRNFEQGFQSFAFHPDFHRRGRPGYGKLYTYVDTGDMALEADFKPTGEGRTHHTVLVEWTAKNPAARVYDGGAPRELMRFEQPFRNHNGGQIAFNPLASPRDADYGLLYIGSADGGSGGDPYNMAQNLRAAFGKILRIDPLGSNSANGRYGIPASNPFARDSAKALPEIYAYGVRNPQRLFWDSKTKRMFMSDIGQGAVEEISPVTAGANLGWNAWEGSFRYLPNRQIAVENPRRDRNVTYPVAEYDHSDPILLGGMAAIGGFVYRGKAIPQLKGKLVFGDNPSGEIFYVDADKLPEGGQDALRRILFDDGGKTKTFLQLIQEKTDPPAARADLRFGEGPDGKVFILNKWDNIIRILLPPSKK